MVSVLWYKFPKERWEKGSEGGAPDLTKIRLILIYGKDDDVYESTKQVNRSKSYHLSAEINVKDVEKSDFNILRGRHPPREKRQDRREGR